MYVGKKFKWFVKDLFVEKLMQRREREEALMEAECEMRESICELEKGPIFGEEDNDDEMKRRMLETYS